MNSTLNSTTHSIPATPIRKKSKQISTPLTYRIMIAWRFALALVGGYIIAMYSSIVIAQCFAQYRASAAMSATLIAFTLHACAFIWVFMVNKTLKASLGIILPAFALYVLAQVIGT